MYCIYFFWFGNAFLLLGCLFGGLVVLCPTVTTLLCKRSAAMGDWGGASRGELLAVCSGFTGVAVPEGAQRCLTDVSSAVSCCSSLSPEQPRQG